MRKVIEDPFISRLVSECLYPGNFNTVDFIFEQPFYHALPFLGYTMTSPRCDELRFFPQNGRIYVEWTTKLNIMAPKKEHYQVRYVEMIGGDKDLVRLNLTHLKSGPLEELDIYVLRRVKQIQVKGMNFKIITL